MMFKSTEGTRLCTSRVTNRTFSSNEFSSGELWYSTVNNTNYDISDTTSLKYFCT